MDAHHLVVAGDADVSIARRVVRETFRGASPEAVYAAELVVTELVTNGLLHGGGVASVSVERVPTGVRIEARDRNRHAPLVAVDSPDSMTGRGLHLVRRLAARWGVQPTDDGKVVWAEVADAPITPGEYEEEDLLAAWGHDLEDEAAPLPSRVRISLGSVPTPLVVAAKRHVDNLVREFLLAASGDRSGTTAPVPEPLALLVDRVVHRFEEARLAMKRQATDAARVGAAQTTIELDLSLDAADAAEEYLEALDDADAYCRANRMLTLETPPQHRIFRRWYIGEVVKQVRAARQGDVRPPVMPFEQRLLAEVDAADQARRRAERAARLYRVAVALASAVAPEDVSQAVLTEGVEALGASGGGVLLATDADVLAVPGTVGYAEPVVALLRVESPDAELPAAHALRTGEAVWLETVEERDARFPQLAGLEPNTVAICAVPVTVEGVTLAALRFSFTQRRLFDADEQQFVMALAAEAAEALQRARLLESEREARHRLEYERQSLQKLAAVGEAMFRRRDLDAILQLATDAATQIAGAEFGAFLYSEPEDGDGFSHVTFSGAERELFAGFATARNMAIFSPVFTGTGVVRLEDVTLDSRYGDNDLYFGMPDDRPPVRSFLGVPVTLSGGQVVGGLFFGHREAARFGEDTERLALGVAGQAAAAIENVRSVEERVQVAAILQQSLLPAALPDVPGAHVAAAYAAARHGIGGDFYDIYPLAPSQWGIAIGDVRGRGPQAAALTALARYTIRTAAMLGRGPADVLAVLNDAMHSPDDPERFCTAVFGVLDLGTDGPSFTYANAGHPPFALVRGGEVEMARTTGALAGCFRHQEFTERVVPLASGDRIVLYTDGITEARRHGQEFGESRLPDVLQRIKSEAPQAMVDALTAEAQAFSDGGATDDAAVFVVAID